MFVHGKNTVVLADSSAWTGQLTQFSAGLSQQAVNATPFGSTDMEYVAGLKDGSLSLNGMFEAATIDADVDALHAAGTLPISVCVDGDTVGNRAFVFNGHVDDYQLSGPTNDLVRLTVSNTGSGPSRFGVVLHDLSAETTTVDEASVDDGASSASGFVANLHVTAFSGTSCTIELEDSADDAAWANLGSFASVTGVGSERLVGTGAVDRYVRVAITGGTFSSVTFAVTFARLR